MNFGHITTAECLNTAPPPDPRCQDPAFALANPDICFSAPMLIIKPAVSLTCTLGSVQFRAFYVKAGVETDVTNQSIFTSSNMDVALIGAVSGNATGLSMGQTIITAAYLDLTAQTELNVLGDNCCSDRQVAMMLMVDTSRSMSQAFGVGYSTRLDYAKAAATRFISEVNEAKDIVGLMRFNAADDAVLAAPTSNKASVEALVPGMLQTQNLTTFYDAISTAMDELAATSANIKVLVLISDGEDQTDSYLSNPNPIQLVSDFKAQGGIVICFGVRASGKGFNLLSTLATGGFFLNAYPAIAAQSLDYLSGLKGYTCAGNCTPAGDVMVASGQLDYDNFTFWNVVGGTVDLLGNGFFDYLPGTGLHVELIGNTPALGTPTAKMVTKSTFPIVAGHTYSVSVKLAGNQVQEHIPPDSVSIKVYDGTKSYVDALVTISDFKQGYQVYSYSFTAESDSSVNISVQQIAMANSALPGAWAGAELKEVKFEDKTDGTSLFFDNFDTENIQYVPPACGIGSTYAYIQSLGHFGYAVGYNCYGEGCLDNPPSVQTNDPNPLPDIEAGFTPPKVYTSTKNACASCPAGSINNAGPLIPVMTSPTAPSGTADASSEHSGAEAWEAFSGPLPPGAPAGTPGWDANHTAAFPQFLRYAFAAPATALFYGVTHYTRIIVVGLAATRNDLHWLLQGSNNGTTWTTLDERTANANPFTALEDLFQIASPAAFSQYRLFFPSDSTNSAGYAVIVRLQLYGSAAAQVCKDATETSMISQADADTKAYNAAHALALAELNCTPIYTSSQSFTAHCPFNQFGPAITKSATATSLISQADADSIALAAAQAAAMAALVCNLSNNDQPITINDLGNASPYPSVKNVSGLTGHITKVTVALKKFSHQFPEDVRVVLMAPDGVTCVELIRRCGGSFAVGITPVTPLGTPLDFVFDDAAGSFLPDSTILSSGTFKPSQYSTGGIFPFANPPPLPYLITLAGFIGLAASVANGSWALCVVDVAGLHVGSFALGWDLTITMGP